MEIIGVSAIKGREAKGPRAFCPGLIANERVAGTRENTAVETQVTLNDLSGFDRLPADESKALIEIDLPM
jgi:hypothetical protein